MQSSRLLTILSTWISKSLRRSSPRRVNHFPHPDDVAKAVQATARGSYHLPKTLNDSVNQVRSFSISSKRAMQAQVKMLDKDIERQVALSGR